MKFLGIDKALEGLKRGAEKFGGKIAKKSVKKVEHRNGFTPKEPEPYGLGMGGADTEQSSPVPTQAENVKIGIEPAKLRQQNKLDFLKKELPLSQDKAEREAIEYEIKQIEKELALVGEHGDPDAREEKASTISNEDSSALGFQSTQKTTTAQQSDYENALSPEAAKQILRDLQVGMPDEGGYIRADLLSDAEYAQYKEAMLTLGLRPKIKTNENTDPSCKLCKGTGVSDSGTACQACALKSVKNAGHLSPEAWEKASTEEHVQWLKAAQMDINLAGLHFTDLSQDVRIALQDVHDYPSSANNASGLQKHFTFRDINGEEETVEATDETAAWVKLAHDFATPLEELKGMGMKLVRTNENTSNPDEQKRILEEIKKSEAALAKLRELPTSPEVTQRLKDEETVLAGLRRNLTNDNPSGDLEEIARHAEGIEHEVEELAEEGLEFSNCAGACGCKEESHRPEALQPCACTCPECTAKKKEYSFHNSVGEEQAKEIWFSANINRLEGLLEDLGLDSNLASGGWDDLSASARDRVRPHLKGEWSSGNTKEDSIEMKNAGLKRGEKYGTKKIA